MEVGKARRGVWAPAFRRRCGQGRILLTCQCLTRIRMIHLRDGSGAESARRRRRKENPVHPTRIYKKMTGGIRTHRIFPFPPRSRRVTFTSCGPRASVGPCFRCKVANVPASDVHRELRHGDETPIALVSRVVRGYVRLLSRDTSTGAAGTLRDIICEKLELTSTLYVVGRRAFSFSIFSIFRCHPPVTSVIFFEREREREMSD